MSSKAKCWYHLQMGLISLCLYLIVPTVVYVSLVFYLSLLKLLLESPTSQLFQLILTLVPLTFGLSGLIIQKKLESRENAHQPNEMAELDSDEHSSDDETNHGRERKQRKQGYHRLVSEQAGQPQDTTNTGDQNQPERRQPRRRRGRVDNNQQQEGGQAAQESSSQEIQVVVEQHQDIATHNESTL